MAALVVLVLGAYLPLIWAEFVLDDVFLIEKNSLVSNVSSLVGVWGRPYWSGSIADNALVYRPLTSMTYVLTAVVVGLKPWTFHLTNLLLYLATWILMLKTLLGHQIEPRIGVMGLEGNERSSEPGIAINQIPFVILFLVLAVHPLASEPVAGVSYRTDLLVGFFWVLGLWVHQRYIDRKRRWLLSACLMAALLSKESGVLLPLSWIFLGGPEISAKNRKSESKPGSLVATLKQVSKYDVMAVSLVVLMYALARRVALGAWFSGTEIPFLDNPLVGQFGFERFSSALKVLGLNFALFFFPWPLSPDYSYRALLDLSPGWGMLGLLGLGLLFWAWWKALSRKSEEWGAVGLSLAIVSILFTSNLFFLISNIRAERFLYLPYLGLAMSLLGSQRPSDPSKNRKSQRGHTRLLERIAGKPWQWAFLGVLLCTFWGLTHLRARAWRNEYTLFSEAAQTIPKSARVHLNYGNSLFKQGRLQEARAEYEKAVELYPEFVLAWTNLGVALSHLGLTSQAKQAVDTALRHNPGFKPALQAKEVLQQAR